MLPGLLQAVPALDTARVSAVAPADAAVVAVAPAGAAAAAAAPAVPLP